jgi:hypothetical protein
MAVPTATSEGWVMGCSARIGPFFPAEPPGPYLRITFSAAATVADLDAGARRLAAAEPRLRRAPGAE